jgi:ligand-binding sensor protein
MQTNKSNFVQERLARSDIFKDYERAFGEATGLPLTLSPVEDWHLAHHGRRHENPFCALLARHNKACAACLSTQYELAAHTDGEPRSVTCFAGLRETAVPLRVGERTIGFLRTGEVLLQKPQGMDFARMAKQLRAWGLESKLEEFKSAFLKSPVLSPKRYDSIVHLLKLFAEHLSLVANQITFQSEHAESPNMARARRYIDEHKTEHLSLKQVATAVHMSSFYFCKQFRKAVGCTFTEYLARVRVEAPKQCSSIQTRASPKWLSTPAFSQSRTSIACSKIWSAIHRRSIAWRSQERRNAHASRIAFRAKSGGSRLSRRAPGQYRASKAQRRRSGKERRDQYCRRALVL